MNDKSGLFAWAWRIAAPPHARELITLEGEFRFAPPRRWRSDWSLTNPQTGRKVLVEVEGGVWTGGRHTRGEGYTLDCEKYNAAAERGYYVLRYTPAMLEGDTFAVIAQVLAVLGYIYPLTDSRSDDDDVR